MNAVTTAPINLATVAESNRDAVIATMTDEQVFAADCVLRNAIRELEERRGTFLTRSGQVRVSERNNPNLHVVDRNLEIYRRCMLQLASARDAAAERRVANAIRENARESTLDNLNQVARRLADLAAAVERAKADVTAGAPCLETVANVQHELTWGLANMNFATLVRRAAKADGLN